MAPCACTDDRTFTSCSSRFENNFFTEMCSGSEAGLYFRLIDFVYHSTLGLRVIKAVDALCLRDRPVRLHR